jgi:aminomethyltransferase
MSEPNNPADGGLKRTSLYAKHVAAGGRMVPFAGYEMPVQYTGIIAEARAVRERAGMFDVSHMARLALTGDGVEEFIERVTSNDVAKLTDRSGQYSLLPNEHGGTVDDIIVYRRAPDSFQMVVNASNHGKDVEWLQEHNGEWVLIDDETESTAMIAVQGPAAAETLAGMPGSQGFRDVPAFGVLDVEVGGVACNAARSGYTGEDGYELICRADDAGRLWDALIEAGVTPCGLGSRDTLRVEAGLPLYGHELTDDLSPIAAGLGWVIGKMKGFIGSAPIREAMQNGTSRRLLGVRLASKRLITPGMKVFDAEGREIGEVTSGVVSPLLDCAIALAMVDREVAAGAAATIEIRGKHEPGTLVNKRFYVRKRS